MSALRSLLLLCFVVACSGTKETGDTSSGEGPSYALVADGLGAALFSVWGDATDNVWAVGANDGAGPLMMHYDGDAWERIDTSSLDHDFWWVWGSGDQLFVGGSKGHMVRYTPSTGELSDAVIADASLTFFGVWGADTENVWAVAGDPTNELPGAIFRFDGSAWSQSTEASLSDGGGVRAARSLPRRPEAEGEREHCFRVRARVRVHAARRGLDPGVPAAHTHPPPAAHPPSHRPSAEFAGVVYRAVPLRHGPSVTF